MRNSKRKMETGSEYRGAEPHMARGFYQMIKLYKIKQKLWKPGPTLSECQKPQRRESYECIYSEVLFSCTEQLKIVQFYSYFTVTCGFFVSLFVFFYKSSDGYGVWEPHSNNKIGKLHSWSKKKTAEGCSLEKQDKSKWGTSFNSKVVKMDEGMY